MSPEPANLSELRPFPAKLGLAVLLALPLASLATIIARFLPAKPMVLILTLNFSILAPLFWIAIGYGLAAWIFRRPLAAGGWRAKLRENLRIVAIALVALNAGLIYWIAKWTFSFEVMT